ncbi:MAG: ATP synthase F1 subunit delta [Deltaproteobacteria bacterium]|nr:ATP synthase F1 subunit delta [Deltaproteobacteria bacterium]
MREQVLAKRYAKALFDLGLEEKLLERFGEELGRLKKAFAAEPAMLKLLSLRELKPEKKEKIVESLSGKLLLSPWVKNFLKLAVQRRRIGHFMAMAKAFADLTLASENRLVAKVSAAEQTSLEALRDELKKSLEKLTGRKVEFEIEEKPALLGGFQVTVGDTLYDASLAGELKRLREATWT